MASIGMGDIHKGISFEGEDCFEYRIEQTSSAKFLPGQADKFFVAGAKSGLIDTSTG